MKDYFKAYTLLNNFLTRTKNLLIFSSLIFSIFTIVSCGTLHKPVYVPKINNYSFNANNFSNSITTINNTNYITDINSDNASLKLIKTNKNLIQNHNLISESIVKTYTVESLEKSYRQIFCARLSNCSININNIKNSSKFNYFDLNKHPIKNNPYNIESIDLYRILYSTKGQFNESRIVSGAIFLPKIKDIKGVILFFHPTFFDKNSVLSYDYNGYTAISIASIFSANGYIVVAPDYIGMGYDRHKVHPYILYPQVNVFDGLSILKATKQFLKDKEILLKSEEIPLYISGYSEGSNYALWFSRLYQEQRAFKDEVHSAGFNLKKVVPIAGPYNLSGVIYNYLISDVTVFNKSEFNVPSSIYAGILKPSLLVTALISYAHYSDNNNFLNNFNPGFFNMICSSQLSYNCKFAGKKINLLQALNESNDFKIVTKISNAAWLKYHNNKLFFKQNNSILPLINKNLLENSNFMDTLTQGDIYFWRSQIPTTLIYLNEDSIVSSYNSIYAYRGMLEAGSVNVEQIVVDNQIIKENQSSLLPNFNVDHISGLYYLFIIALNQFDQTLLKTGIQ